MVSNWILLYSNKKFRSYSYPRMVLILDGNSEIDAQVRSNLNKTICVRYVLRSRAVTTLKYLKRPELPSSISTMVESLFDPVTHISLYSRTLIWQKRFFLGEDRKTKWNTFKYTSKLSFSKKFISFLPFKGFTTFSGVM